MLRKLRIAAALLCFAPLTLLFLDFTGTAHRWFGWLAKVQFLPALLAANLAIVAALVLLTFLFGRIYCSTLCPLGVFQDVVSWISGRRKKNRFSPSPERRALRYGTLAIFAVLLLGGFGSVFALLDPYGAYGRMVASLLGPVYGWGNNLLARLAARGQLRLLLRRRLAEGRGHARGRRRDLRRACRADVEKRPDLLQHPLPRRNDPRHALPVFPAQAPHRGQPLQPLRPVRAQLQGRLHRPRGEPRRLLALRRLPELHGKLPQRRPHLHPSQPCLAHPTTSRPRPTPRADASSRSPACSPPPP